MRRDRKPHYRADRPQYKANPQTSCVQVGSEEADNGGREFEGVPEHGGGDWEFLLANKNTQFQ